MLNAHKWHFTENIISNTNRWWFMIITGKVKWNRTSHMNKNYFSLHIKQYDIRMIVNQLIYTHNEIKMIFNLPSLAMKFVFACSKQKSGEWKLSTNVDSTFSSELSLTNSNGDGFCATCNRMKTFFFCWSITQFHWDKIKRKCLAGLNSEINVFTENENGFHKN